MKKVVKIYIGNKVFECIDYTFNAPRMGSAPTITTKLKSLDSLDSDIKDKGVYAEYNGEKYLLLNTPKSSKSNEDARFEYDFSFVAGRFILDNIYLHDTDLKTTEIRFGGTIKEYANYINKSLEYSGLSYRVVVDKGVESESKFFSLNDTAISSAIQESYKQYEIPYYYVGEEIHFGYPSDVINHVFKYGINDGLLNISKTPVGNKIINRATGVGSEENIPYYYPNEHPLGIVDTYYTPNGGDKTLRNDLVVNKNKFAEKVKNATELMYNKTLIGELASSYYIYNKGTYDIYTQNYGSHDYHHWVCIPDYIYNEEWNWKNKAELGVYKKYNQKTEPLWFSKTNNSISVKITPNYLLDYLSDDAEIVLDAKCYDRYNRRKFEVDCYTGNWNNEHTKIVVDKISEQRKLTKQSIKNLGFIYVVFTLTGEIGESRGDSSVEVHASISLKPKDETYIYHWYDNENNIAELSNFGLSLNDTPSVGDEITFQTREGSLIPFQNTLMPPKYRERQDVYYNAVNDTYELPDGSGKYEFAFPYSSNDIREHKETFDFIKPSIEYVKYNYDDKELPVNMFVEFAYDTNDNDEVDEEKNEYIHPYFFGKLRPLGFNLFNSANEKGEMTISMTSGSCGACNFVIGVDENTKRNIVQVDDNGNLLREENGDVKFGLSQEKQNDTTNNYVWIALKKDTETYTNIRPNATYNYRPKACSAIDATDGDTFVILNITLPTKYILEAEKELEREIIAYLKENNDEKFSFSIKFSRIFLAKNPSIAKALNENARIQVEYNNDTKPFYITSYTYKCVGNEALPEISVELSEELKFNESFLQRALSNVEKSVLSKVGDMDFAVQIMKYFLRKDVNDVANGLINFQKGATFGANENAKFDEQGNADFVSQIIRQYISTPQFIDGFAGTGFKLWLDENGKSNLTVDNITAREAFRVFEMLVTKLRAVNGGLFVSAANGTIKEVVDSGEYYDIILENDNTFVAGDYMRCQVMSGLKMMDYWVEIHTTNGKTCRVLKSEFGDVMPLVGQDVVLDGSRNENRQGAIYITANEDGLPRIEVLDNISTKSHDGCLKTRLGSLSDIVDATFGGQLSGYGLYSDNVYLKGEFILKNTKANVETTFEIQDGKIKSGIAQTQAEALRGKSLLYNASFIEGLKGWLTSNEQSVYFSGNAMLFSGSSLLNQSVSVSSEPIFDNVFFITIDNGWIRQSNMYFVNKPAFDSSTFYPLYFSANVRCKTSGVLSVKLAGVNLITTTATRDYEIGENYGYGKVVDFNAFVVKKPISKGDLLIISSEKICNCTKQEFFSREDKNTTVFPVMEEVVQGDLPIFSKNINATSNFVNVNANSMWAGVGDFYLEFTGEADFYGLTIFTEKTEVKYSTLFEQTDKLVRFASEKIDSDGNTLNGAAVRVETEGDKSGTYLDVVYQKDGETQRQTLGEFSTQDGQTKIKLSGENIILEGDITANGKVNIDSSTGKLSADEATFTNVSLKSSELLDNGAQTGYSLNLNNNGLLCTKNISGVTRTYMKLSAGNSTDDPLYRPRLLFTNGYTSADDNEIYDTSLMLNDLFFSEKQKANEFERNDKSYLSGIRSRLLTVSTRTKRNDVLDVQNVEDIEEVLINSDKIILRKRVWESGFVNRQCTIKSNEIVFESGTIKETLQPITITAKAGDPPIERQIVVLGYVK